MLRGRDEEITADMWRVRGDMAMPALAERDSR
jgi:hypothetical protein